MDTPDLTTQGITAFKNGDRRAAQRLLSEALAQKPQDARAWMWLAACLDDPQRRRYCLEKALALQPELPGVRRALETLPKPPPRPGENETYAVSQSAAAEIINASPPTADSADNEPPCTPAESLPTKARRPPTPRKDRRRDDLSGVQIFFLVLLGAAAVFALVAAVNIIAPEAFVQAGAPPAAGLSVPRTGAVKAATMVIPTVPTRTPTPAPASDAAPTLRPTGSLAHLLFTPTPIASITPMHGYSRFSIGRSVQNRAIEVFRFGSGEKERMIIAGIHGGDEQNTIDLADELIAHLGDHPQLIPRGYTLYILRALNPDGSKREVGPGGRLNANGVDLNRNFDTNWKAAWRSTGCASAPGTAGSGPGSEPETQVVKKFLADRQIEALIVYHSAALGVFPSGSPAHPGSVRLAQAIAGITNYAYPPMDTGCEYSGTLVDWAGDHGVVAAVDLELNAVHSTEFEQNLKVLELLMAFPAERSIPTVMPPPGLTPFPTVIRLNRTPTP